MSNNTKHIPISVALANELLKRTNTRRRSVSEKQVQAMSKEMAADSQYASADPSKIGQLIGQHALAASGGSWPLQELRIKTPVEIDLHTSDGCIGSIDIHVDDKGNIVKRDPISWDGETQGHTLTAEIGDILIHGDVWRDLEDHGDLDAVIRAVATGKATTAEDVELFGGIPQSPEQKRRQRWGSKYDAASVFLRQHGYVLKPDRSWSPPENHTPTDEEQDAISFLTDEFNNGRIST